ncbi:killer toxin resistant protein [Recurvomyces mirabilis]|uniref:Killer toxin resistant protein n=1 Tax=Recurvomyces mirabilis TaxID=574656 RepID=A0AAE0TUV6_9PEZI|nr:killer toxin resistant protein [Recurvomyces mirabilis]KAK5158546.1 killer toxin resistant protein [Recurvomyces mirabilis]
MRVTTAGLLWSGASLLQVQAVPSVNVAVKTAFNAPPYLVELLETAAEENTTSYFPLLDRIADGYFDGSTIEQELYSKFRGLLQEDGHLTKPEDLSSFDFALSIHSTAPRIEAHYQYYNTSVRPSLGQDKEDICGTWAYVPFSGQRYCSPDLAESSAQVFGKPSEDLHKLAFDRVLGGEHNGRPSVLYADITSESFKKFHKTMSKTARDSKTSYRVRYQPSTNAAAQPLTVSGYGVELALKRTDYIVIDDRKEGEEEQAQAPAGETTLVDDEVSDLRPLSSSELLRLGLKASSFVMASESPFDTLLRLTQDFPKHSSAIASTNVSTEFYTEHQANREALLPPGFNVLWINGVQIMPRDVDAYSLLEHLRRERKMISSVRDLGLTGPEAINLLAHEAITASAVDQEVQRYDWRDGSEGGNVIMWLNDIEKDKRYAEWSGSVTALLQRTYPGQLPSVRRDIHNLVITIDFSNYADVMTVVDSLQTFVKRKVPIRFGLVPRTTSAAGVEQARVVYYLLDRYGLAPALDYLTKSVTAGARKFGAPQEKYFTQATDDRKLRKDHEALTFEDVLADSKLDEQLKGAQAYVKRLGGDAQTKPPVLINGAPIAHTDEWLQSMSQRVSLDLRVVQTAVYEGELNEDTYLPELFLGSASLRRNPTVVPEDDKNLKHIDMGQLPGFAGLPSVPASVDTIERELVQMTVVADFETRDGFAQLMEALLFQRQHDNVEIAALSSATSSREYSSDFLKSLLSVYDDELEKTPTGQEVPNGEEDYARRSSVYENVIEAVSQSSEARKTIQPADLEIVDAIGLSAGEKALVINGRVVGPVAEQVVLEIDDLDALLSYERKKRLLPAALAIESLQLQDKASSPLAFALISNLIALSQVSDMPEGIFEAAPTVRTGVYKQWNSTHTAIKIGDLETANIQIYSALDPASEMAQRWLPVIKALSELEGVAMTLFLNPQNILQELPVKRFYRYVLDSKPSFEKDGSLRQLSARFSGLPAEALLNIGMDLPPSWLVAPKDSMHDLDNIKLSVVKSGADIEATYELEHILIEGHSRDVTLGPPPRGAQLVLGTESDAHAADTIIMANLGYFQFKANPGVYSLALQKGRSEEIFHIDSAGTLGYAAQAGDNTTEIALMSFRGATLFPRLSRKPNMEDEDVLEATKSALENLAEGTEKVLAQVGLKSNSAGKYLSKAARLGTSLISGKRMSTDVSTEAHADINIFSVASGHLYERMLNIMMLSVMKNTKHSVKFWFIEQFLSPSFKTFLPTLAEELGFKYEMVTYKWPHWLRGQKEKQREIWGYKILFLDVLFPLDLDKVIFVDADQIVRTDMYELVQHDLKGAPYGFTPMCDSRTEMEGFRFWKQGYWKNFLKGLPYHISALYVVDLKKFRQIAAGDRLRQQYHQLSADPGSLSNLDQDLPNHMQMVLPIHSLPQEWLWCETWCSDEALKEAKTIDLCNNPQTKEPKLDRARRQVPEWTKYDDEIAVIAKKHRETEATGRPVAGDASDAGVQGEEESIQERLQREDAERELKKNKKHDEL